MKKCLSLILLLCFLFFAFSTASFSSAETMTSAYSYAERFAALYPVRTAESGEEGRASSYLSSALSLMGYEVATPSFKYYNASSGASSSASRLVEYNHVIGIKDFGKEKTVLIGGYYGSFSPSDSGGAGEGAEVALGVGAILSAAEKIALSSPDYNVAVAFWGGLELSDFDVKKCGVNLKTLALYINVDGVAAGKYDYLFTDDVPRSHDAYFLSVIEKAGAFVKKAPAFKRASSFYAVDGAYSYTHLGLAGANVYFLNEEIPCASFVGGDWEKEAGLYRYADKADVAGTRLDTFTELNARNGGKSETEARLASLSNVIAQAVTGEGLKPALEKSAKDVTGADLNSRLAYLLILLIGGAAVIAFFVVLILKQGKDRKEKIWENSFDTPRESRSDPFSDFSEEEKKSEEEKSDRDDDVFRF